MGNITSWLILIPSLVVFILVLGAALYLAIALAGGAPIAPWNW